MKLCGRIYASLLCGAIAVSGAMGCAKTTTQVVIDAPETTNEGSPLHMMVRAIPDSLEQETYEQAAAKMFVQPADESVVATQPIFPGERSAISLPDVGKGDIVIYFFFTTPEPKDGFRIPIRRPIPAEINVVLGEHKVDRVQVRRR
jgi:hypothetical protein